MAVPKRRRSKKRQRQIRGQLQRKFLRTGIPKLVKLASGKKVPRHLVTPENSIHKGVKLLGSSKKK